MELKPCPFCGSKKTVLFSWGMNSEKSYYLCESCDTTGPEANTPKKAQNLWNKRAKETEK